MESSSARHERRSNSRWDSAARTSGTLLRCKRIEFIIDARYARPWCEFLGRNAATSAAFSAGVSPSHHVPVTTGSTKIVTDNVITRRRACRWRSRDATRNPRKNLHTVKWKGDRRSVVRRLSDPVVLFVPRVSRLPARYLVEAALIRDSNARAFIRSQPLSKRERKRYEVIEFNEWERRARMITGTPVGAPAKSSRWRMKRRRSYRRFLFLRRK